MSDVEIFLQHRGSSYFPCDSSLIFTFSYLPRVTFLDANFSLSSAKITRKLSPTKAPAKSEKNLKKM